MEEELKFGADHYLRKLMDRKTMTEYFWSGLQFAMIFLALVLSIYSVYSFSKLHGVNKAESADITELKKGLLIDEERESDQLQLIMKLNETIQSLRRSASIGGIPVMFDCHRKTRQTNAGVVTYDGCYVDTTDGAMDMTGGIFTVREPGIYQLSFTAKYVSSSKGRFGAWSDIFVNETVIADSQREYNGNDGSKTESSTHSVIALHPLVKGDVVKVQFNKDGTSYIHSDSDHDVHFTVRRVSALPPSKRK